MPLACSFQGESYLPVCAGVIGALKGVVFYRWPTALPMDKEELCRSVPGLTFTQLMRNRNSRGTARTAATLNSGGW